MVCALSTLADCTNCIACPTEGKQRREGRQIYFAQQLAKKNKKMKHIQHSKNKSKKGISFNLKPLSPACRRHGSSFILHPFIFHSFIFHSSSFLFHLLLFFFQPSSFA
jgi:hypothetical protein